MTMADEFEMQLASNAKNPNAINMLINMPKYKEEINKLVNEAYAGGVPKGSIEFKDGSIAGNYPKVLIFDTPLGRPIVGKKPKNKRSEIRMDEDERERLLTLSKKSNMSISQYVNYLVKKEWESEINRENNK